MEEAHAEVLLMKLVDFTSCELSKRNLEYAGRAGEKRGIVYQGENWFLKFPKSTRDMRNTGGLSYVTSPLSEYLGSHIYQLLGYRAHDTLLGVYDNGVRKKIVCACKDFIADDKNEILIPYTALRNDTNEKVLERKEESPSSASNINEIIYQLANNTVLSQIPYAKERFWDVMIIDILINNNDRNEDNWGVIKYKKEEKYVLAPIFDCGNCFYGKTDETRIRSILDSEEKLLSSAINGVTAYEGDDETRLSAKKILSLNNDDLANALQRVYGKVTEKISEIELMIQSIPTKDLGMDVMSDVRKEYYIKTMKLRLECLLKPQLRSKP
jgi:hypothetical protein